MDKTFCNQREFMTDYFDQINFYMYEGPAARIRTRNIPKDFYTCKLGPVSFIQKQQR